MMNRLFIALTLPERNLLEINEYLEQVVKNKKSFKWEEKDKLHLTLKFLGDTDFNAQKKIESFIENNFTDILNVSGSIKKFDFLFRDNTPSILWAELLVDRRILDFARKLEYNMFALGFKRENRKFKPHITLLRIKNFFEKELVESFKNFKIKDNIFYFEELVLYKSTLNKTGSVYQKVLNKKLT